MNRNLLKIRFLKLLATTLILPFVSSCSGLLPKQTLQTTFYSLQSSQLDVSPSSKLNNSKLPNLVISTPNAAVGFETSHMMYTRNLYQLEYFASNEWIGTPANMLHPLIVATINKKGSFNAVLKKNSLVKTELRLESEIVRLLQVFSSTPSYVQFTLRISIIDNATSKVIAQNEFDERVYAESDDPVGGVLAANKVVNLVLEKLSIFSNEATMSWLKSNIHLSK